MKELKYLIYRVGSRFNRVIELKSSQTTQRYTTKVFYKQFSCHHHIKNHFSSQIF
jgi:hypothetical protein